jgi:hypothetical protein
VLAHQDRRERYEVDSASSHCLLSGTRRIERRNTHHMKPDNAAAAKVIAAIAQCRTANDDTAPIRAQSPRAPTEPKAPSDRPWVGDSHQIEPPHQSGPDQHGFSHPHTMALIWR